MSSAAAPPQRRPWIVSAPYDLAFFVGTPALVAALVLPLGRVGSSIDVYLAVMAFSSVGHHLPGFLRAYGDRELFRRHRTRFLLAPPLLYGVFLAFGVLELHGMLLLLMAWSIWHVTMQHYGFLRIYDAKVGSTTRAAARLDWLVSVLGFAAIVLASPDYVHDLLANVFQSGGPSVPAAWIAGLRTVVWAAFGVAAAAWLAHAARSFRTDRPVSVIKMGLMAVTLGFLWYVWVGLGDLVLGLATWEVFHDVQYFAITWVYNRRLVAKGLGGEGRLMGWLFRGHAARAALYVGAIAAYGGASWALSQGLGGALGAEVGWRAPLVALVLTSTILHYYYDGFIWKVRQERTRAGLDLEPAEVAVATRHLGPRVAAIAHGALFALPIGAVAALELAADAPDAERQVLVREAIRDAAPGSARAHRNLARAYADIGRGEEALAEYEAALAIDRRDDDALGGRAVALLELHGEERADEAEADLTRARALDPRDARHALNRATLRLARGDVEAALADWRDAARLDPTLPGDHADARLLAGLEALAREDLPLAAAHLDRALALDPDGEDARRARTLVTLRLVHLHLTAGRFEPAVALLREHLAANPDDAERALWLAELLATNADDSVRDGVEALGVTERLVTGPLADDPRALDVHAAALAETGDFARAASEARRAARLARAAGRPELAQLADAIDARAELYEAGKPYRQGTR